MYSELMSMIGLYLMSGAGGAGGLRACSDKSANTSFFIRTSEQGAEKQMSIFAGLAPVLTPTSERKTQKRARTRAKCITIRMTGSQIMPLTLGGAGGGADWPPSFFPTPESARNRLQTRQGEKTARWCTWAYIEGESLKPNAVSSDLARFHTLALFDSTAYEWE